MPTISATNPADMPGGAYVIDKSHSSLIARVRHVGLSAYTVRFTGFDATYSYDPKAQRSDRIKEIVGDIEKCGLSLSDDTIRSYLRVAAELLPPKENPNR